MRHRTDSGNVQHRCRSRSVYVETHPPSDCASFVVRGLWHSREDFTTIQKETEPVWKPETHPVSTVCVFCRSAGRFGAGRWRKPKAVVCFERWESAGVRRGQLVHAAELCSSRKVPSGEESSLDIKKWPSVMTYCLCFLASHLSPPYQTWEADYECQEEIRLKQQYEKGKDKAQ